MPTTLHDGRPVLHTETVQPEWVDYNHHMNVAFYVLAFDRATDAFLDTIGMTQARRDASGSSVFVAEQHVTYEQEVMEGERLEMTAQLLDADAKRLRLFLSMHRATDGARAATTELMILHVNLNDRRVGPFPDEVAAEIEAQCDAHAGLPTPGSAGRGIAMKRG